MIDLSARDLDLAKHLVLRVRVVKTRRFRLRLWLALKLARLASFVAGVGYEQEETSLIERVARNRQGGQLVSPIRSSMRNRREAQSVTDRKAPRP